MREPERDPELPARSPAAAPRVEPRALRLIAITDRRLCGGAEGLADAVRRAAEGGLPALQMREKDLPPDEARRLGLALAEIRRARGTLFVVNGDAVLAESVGADGLHTGARGIPLAEARRRLGPRAILGYSAHSEEEALRAFDDGADYAFLSPIFPTRAKTPGDAPIPIGTEPLRRLAARAPGPVVALGGIDETNAGEVFAAGAAGIAAIRAIFGAADPKAATERLLAAAAAARR